MSSGNSSITVAFFGATGGVTNAILVHTLKAGYKAAALVRTPEKLRIQLTNQGLDEALINNQLTFVQGNALEVAAVKRTLAASSPAGLPTHVVTGLGGSAKLAFDWRHPGHIAALDNPTICETAAQTLLTAMHEIYAENPHLKATKPLLTFISTTGITRGPEDVPLAMRFLYHQALAVPHVDKKKMEDLYRGDAEKEDSAFRNIVGIRPTLLAGGVSYTDAAGLDQVRTGTEPHPALGYTIKRADVGHWVFENIINEGTRMKKWEGEMITLTS
ncbi:uncharacterized protein Z518_03679 [Rhinocladiella mackenziei CBS 650.93]|uniref:NAD(P)-binding domain-containing protein n=1 Tax=Rhinocladiella mackenziei CBS 650.93 TaxID=1442369 RepID=A0A0D2FUC7_9EURO|nr:uncharacterized protein Z518_03679 [Rhinocladiella mackenziei CBS 650.93]KIX05707.1 hypothetical protein Z518_03679 [Rhinocladiella mackenziei CBS 650.93]